MAPPTSCIFNDDGGGSQAFRPCAVTVVKKTTRTGGWGYLKCIRDQEVSILCPILAALFPMLKLVRELFYFIVWHVLGYPQH